ncbi:MAG: transglycosylase domain-containing protein, partial [Acidimicrobiales bacterium]
PKPRPNPARGTATRAASAPKRARGGNGAGRGPGRGGNGGGGGGGGGRGNGGNRRPRNAPAPKRRSFLWRWRRLFFIVGLLAVATFAGTGYVLAQIDLPPEHFQPQTTLICAADVSDVCTQANAMARLAGEQDRVNVTLDQIPQVLIDAVIATEDRDFFAHTGVDPLGIARAAWQDIRGTSASTQGGSTITQQYVRAVYLNNERTISRKIREAVLAIRIEQELSKQEILERYLNTVYFGRGAYGVGTASRVYFGKDVEELDLAEAAYLAGLIRAPEAADALQNPEEATRRRLTVLDAMLQEGYIDPAAHDAAHAEPWVEGDTILPRPDRQGFGRVAGEEYGSTYFVEYVRRQLLDAGFTNEQIYGGGLRVYTTLDLQAQQAAWNAIHDNLGRPEDPPASLVAIDAGGEVRAMIGGYDFEASEVNLALGAAAGGSGRQAGSAMKPFVLATAVREGVSLNSRFNSPGSLDIPRANGGNTWRVRNYGGTQQGVLNLIDATRVSSNTAYAQLMMRVGPEDVVQLAEDMGFTTGSLEPVNSLVLGAEEVSPLEMASAYSTFGHQGTHTDEVSIVRVVYPDGREWRPEREQRQVLTPEQNAQVLFALRQPVERGTATAARLRVPAGGKTGTTQDNRDAWFVGFLANGMTASVWMGYDPVQNEDGTTTPRFMNNVHGRAVTGGSFPAEIWRDFMAEWLEITGVDPGRFPSVSSFPGEVLNSELQVTTTTLPPCPADASSTTAPCRVTTTTESTTTSTEPTTASTEPTTAPTTTTTTTEVPPLPPCVPPTTPTTAPCTPPGNPDVGD